MNCEQFFLAGLGAGTIQKYKNPGGSRLTTSHLIAPHGGELINLIADTARARELKGHSKEWPSWDLTARQVCDVELLLSGGFSPLRGFMNRADYDGVCNNMRLKSGVLWPMPITLDVTEEFAKSLKPGSSKVALRDGEGVMLAVLNVEDVWQPDHSAEAKSVFGTTSKAHPGADYVINKSNPWNVGGTLEGLQGPSHYDFRSLRLTPRNCAQNSRAWAGVASLLFKLATPCIVRTRNSLSARPSR